MRQIYHTLCPGIPRPQGSMQAMVNKHTGRAIVKYGDQTVQHRNMLIAHISREWGDKPPVTGPLAIGAHFLFPRPKGHYGSGRNAGKLKDSAPEYVTKAPDTDKLMRLLCDAVDIAGICEDDAQFVAIRGEKSFARIDQEPSTTIEIWSLTSGQGK